MTDTIRPATIVCVDDHKAMLAEDGFYIHKDKQSTTLRLASVAVYGNDALKIDLIERMICLNREERKLYGSPRMCSDTFIDEHNFRLEKEVPALVVDVSIIRQDASPETISASVCLDYARAFRHFAFSQITTYIDSRQGTLYEVNGFLSLLRRLGYAETLHGWNDKAKLSREENFVRRLVWLFNVLCANTAFANDVPVIGKVADRSSELTVAKDCFPIFNCPLRHPVAAINNFNLVHFLEYGKPYFKTRDLRRLIRQE